MKKNKIILLLALTLAFALAFSGCGGPQVPADDLPVIATPNVDPSTLERVNVFYAEFPADTTTWVLDDSTEPYVLYYADSLMSDRACNFSVNIGQPFDHAIDQEVLDAFVESYTTANVFITENLYGVAQCLEDNTFFFCVFNLFFSCGKLVHASSVNDVNLST